jgi:hypothetical protein
VSPWLRNRRPRRYRISVTCISEKPPLARVIGFTHLMLFALSSAHRSSLHVENVPVGPETLPDRITVPPFTVPFTEPLYVTPPPTVALAPDNESPACDSWSEMLEVGLTDVPFHVPFTSTVVATLIPPYPLTPWKLAVMRTRPAPLADTSPPEETVAIASFEELQVAWLVTSCGPDMVLANARSWVLPPTAPIRKLPVTETY